MRRSAGRQSLWPMVVAFVMVVGFKQRVDLRTLRRIGERCASAADALSRRIGGKLAEPA